MQLHIVSLEFINLLEIHSKEKVVGLHILAPNAGEITQGFAIGLKLGATKADFDNLIGIHPTVAEVTNGLHCFASDNATIFPG